MHGVGEIMEEKAHNTKNRIAFVLTDILWTHVWSVYDICVLSIRYIWLILEILHIWIRCAIAKW